jgi:hypothetical protein
LANESQSTKEKEEISEEVKEVIGDQYTPWRWKVMMNGEISTLSMNQRIGRWKMNVRHSLFRQEVPDQVFLHVLRSIASTKTSPTRTRWRDVIKGSLRTSLQAREALQAKEREEELSSSVVTV